MALEQQQFQQLVNALQQRQKLGISTKPIKPLSGDAAKLFAITQTAPGEIEQIKQAFQENYRKSLVGITTGTDRRLVKLVDNVADKIGRIRSGGAINKEEEARFKRQIASFKDIPFGKESDALDALDGYLNEVEVAGTAIRPTAGGIQPLQLPPELQEYIRLKKTTQPVAPSDTAFPSAFPSGGDVIPSEITPEQPINERTRLEKVLKTVSAPARFLTGGAGRKIGEAIGTGIARLRATPEERQFITGPTAREIGGDVLNIGLAVAGGGLLGKLGIKGVGVARRGAGKLAQTLETANLRLSPTQKVNLGNKLKTITDYTAKLSGGPKQRLAKARSAIDIDEGKIQRFLSTTAKGKTVDKKTLIKELGDLKTKYANDRDIIGIERQIDSAVKVINRMPSKIPLSKINQFKRTTFKNAYSKAGDKVSDAVEFDIADVSKNSIEKAVKGLKIDGRDIASFNRDYGTKINAGKLLKTATGRAEIGFVGKIIGAITGGTLGTAIGGPAGGAVGAIIGPTIGRKVAGTAVRGAIGRGLRRFGPKAIPEVPVP